MACVNCRPDGESKITRVFSSANASTASKIGSGFSNIPGPPPNGRSSTVLCRSCAQSRNWCNRKSSNPACRARLMMLSSSGPANIAGNKVSTSIFTSSSSSSSSSSNFDYEDEDEDDLASVLDNLQRAAQPLLGAAGQQERPDGVDRLPLPPDDPAHVLRIETQLVHRRALARHRRDRDRLGPRHKPFDNVFEKGLHDGNTTPARPPSLLRPLWSPS